MRLTLFLPGLLLLAAQGASAVSPERETEHIVVAGETLNGIANRAGIPRDRIIEANGLEPPYLIRIGQTLKIPREALPPPRAAVSGEKPSLENEAAYVVEPGDTLGGIANRAKIPRVLIAEANGLTPPYTLLAGQKLVLPRTRHHLVKDGDTGFAISYEYGVPWKDIAVANGLGENDALRTGQTLLIPTVLNVPDPAQSAAAPNPAPGAPKAAPPSRFAWPVTGPVRRGFTARGSGDYHDGIDISAPEGTAVRAAAAGTVIFARKDSDQFGNLVIIDHGDGWHSAYASLGRITVKKGHSVARGERVGLIGDTSITRRTELHFELRKDGKQVDPLGELPRTQ